MDTIGERIKDLRLAYNMSQNDVAEYLEISSGFLGLIERNKRGVTNQNLKKFCTLFNVSSDYLISGTEINQNMMSVIIIPFLMK